MIYSTKTQLSLLLLALFSAGSLQAAEPSLAIREQVNAIAARKGVPAEDILKLLGQQLDAEEADASADLVAVDDTLQKVEAIAYQVRAPQSRPPLLAHGSIGGDPSSLGSFSISKWFGSDQEKERATDSLRSVSEPGKPLRVEASLESIHYSSEDIEGLTRDPASRHSMFGWLGWAVALWLVLLFTRVAKRRWGV